MNDLSNEQWLLSQLSLVWQGNKEARRLIEDAHTSRSEEARDDISDILDVLEDQGMPVNEALAEILEVLEREDAGS